MGGFIDYFMTNNKAEDIDEIKRLTIEIAYYTVAWLVCRD
jgi:hypothetical protein